MNLEAAKEDMDVVDNGLRYDLQSHWFVSIQTMQIIYHLHLQGVTDGMYGVIDHTEGTLSSFMQCDIDTCEPSNLADRTYSCYNYNTSRDELKNFQIRINERRILKAMVATADLLRNPMI